MHSATADKLLDGFQVCQSYQHNKVLDKINDDDMELWLINAPSDMDIAQMNGMKMYLEDTFTRFKSETDGKCYEVLPILGDAEANKLTVIKPDVTTGKLGACLTSLTGHISIMDYVDVPRAEIPVAVKSKVPIPEGIRERYIPFGAIPQVFPSKSTITSRKRKKHKDSSNERTGSKRVKVEADLCSSTDSEKAKKKKKYN